MNRKIFSLFVALSVLCGICASAQIVTTIPEVLQEDSQGVVLYYHADSPLGNNGLKDYTGDDVYAHIGVTTATGDWEHTVANWDVDLPKCKLSRVDANTYALNIGDIRTFFEVGASETVSRLCMVFRNSGGSRQGKAAGDKDIFVDVHQAGLALNFECSAPSVVTKATRVELKAGTTMAADIKISVNGSVIASKTGVSTLSASYDISSEGAYEFKATATADGKTIDKVYSVSWVGASPEREYPGGVPVQGAVDNADGTVTFCFAAPGKTSVTIVPSWDDYKVRSENTMFYQDYNGHRYFWIKSPKLADATDYIYYYLVDGTYSVGDPYAKLVLDPYSDKWLAGDGLGYEGMPEYPAEVEGNVMLAVWRRDMNKYEWSAFEIPSHDRLYIYELLLRDFTGTEGKSLGNGTLAAAMEKIPYIKSLGVNAVELMPIMEFNGNNSWGYNTNFYMAPDKAYGSPKEYKDFIDECHRNGLAVILDIVFNQTDGLAPWYQMYPASSNPFYNATSPHGWSVLNDLNPGYALVEQHYKDVLQYWLREYNVDGFRFDLVKGLGDNGSYGSGTDGFNQSRVDRMKRLHAAIREVKPDAIHINELLGDNREENANAEDEQIGWHNLEYNSGQFVMGWDENNKGVSEFYASNAGRTFCSVSYAESHDEERLGYKIKTYGSEDVKNGRVRARRLAALGAWMALTPGPKMIWQFQELGNDQTTKKGSDNDTSPKRVNWNAVNNEINKHILASYRAAGALRAANETMFGEDASFKCSWSASLASPRTLCVEKDGKAIVAFFNPSTKAAQDVTVSGVALDVSNAELIYACEGFANPSLSGSGGMLRLNVPANSFAIYATKGLSGIDDAVADGSNVSVVGGVGEIIVNGTDAVPAVYDMSGRRVPYAGLSAGIYVVLVDGRSYKVSRTLTMTKTMRLSIASLVAISMAAASCSESRNEGIPQEVAPVYDYFAGYEDRPVLPESMRPEVEAFMTVMGADASDSSLVAWANSPAVSVFTPDVDSVYASLGCIERDLGNMLSRAAAEGLALPRRRYAAVVWGRPESIVFCDSVMLVALNHYLGESYAGYSHLAPYLRRAKTPGRLPYDMAEAIVAVSIPYVRKEGSTALSRMLYEGALVEACRRLVGGSDAQVLGYGDDEYSELLSREGEMWRVLVSKGLIYSTLPSDASRLVSPAPYTTLLSSRTPGRAGRFIGYRIVRSYMERYPEIPLSELLSPKWYSSDDVLRLSRYVGK